MTDSESSSAGDSAELFWLMFGSLVVAALGLGFLDWADSEEPFLDYWVWDGRWLGVIFIVVGSYLVAMFVARVQERWQQAGGWSSGVLTIAVATLVFLALYVSITLRFAGVW